MSRRFHMSLDVRGALLNWKPRDYQNLLVDGSGRTMSSREAKWTLIQELALGRVVLPLSMECDGFDYSGGGCPGHPMPDEVAPESS
jgi:hypothetical protein